MNDAETLYDETIRKLKNNKVIVLLLVAFAVFLGLAQLQGALSGMWKTIFPANTRVHVDVSVQRYDFMVGNIESARPLEPVQGDITDVRQMAEKLAEELTSAIGSPPDRFEAVLRIDGSTLRATKPLRAAVLVFSSPMEQVARVARELGDANNLDLRPIFADPQFTGQGGSSIDMEVSPRPGFFEREPLKIFKRPDGFSFQADVPAQEKTLPFSPHQAKVILSRFEAKGEVLERASAAIESALRIALQKYPSVQLSPLTIRELEKEKQTIQNLGPGAAKSALSNQFNVDYIITGTVLPD
jgi:hypothetical protein